MTKHGKTTENSKISAIAVNTTETQPLVGRPRDMTLVDVEVLFH